MEQFKIKNMYTLSESISGDFLKKFEFPWDAVPAIKDCIKSLMGELDKTIFEERGENVWVAKDVKIADTATIIGPTIIDEGAEIRPGAFIRGNAIVGKGCVVGNSCELKNCILFNGVQVPHYNYVGDSILGYKAHMGAGAVTSNFKCDHGNIVMHHSSGNIKTNQRKMGAMLGDHAEVGCNSVLNPGTVVGRNTIVYPLSRVRGFVPAESIYKDKDDIVTRADSF
ncbi:MAG: UDP-N-acetylglucosamine pyrophosphorylase [Lachnospiraceae bacterium]|nr:UDP-N-acetylglucosamine pyrophosphorylase [Lachnospiraceae bacterium]MBP5298560.1 UDP-N-acetylglucosamine pyrophosphorylase [Lachnospiraceae bacterium]